MADVRATKNGNWSDPTVWNTGALPTTADDVYSNTFTVNVDTSFQVLSLRNTSGTGITAGGTFNFNSGSISGSLTGATPISLGANYPLTISNNTGNVELTLINATTSPTTVNNPYILNSGNGVFTFTVPTITVATTNNAGAKRYLDKTGNGDLIVNSNITLAGGGDQASPSVIVSQAGNVSINGNISAPVGYSNTFGVRPILITAGNLTIVGNITGPQSTIASGFIRTVDFTGTTLNITGSITGGTATTTGIAVAASATNINISGSVVGNVGPGLSITSAANINIIGSIAAGPSAPAINSSGAHTFVWNQPIIASAGSPAIISSVVTATNIFTGPFINNGNIMAVQVGRMFLATGSTSWQFTSDAIGVSQSLFTADQIPTYPSSSDVRLGTVYASGSLTGTLAMPNPLSVQFGVPVDNTTGSAVLTTASLAEAIWNTPRSQLTVSGSIGERLQNVSTPASTGTQISSYLL